MKQLFWKKRNKESMLCRLYTLIITFASLPFCQVMSLLYENVVCKFRNSRPEVFCKKEILAQVFSYEFCEIFKNTFFYRTYLVAASVSYPEVFGHPMSAD